MNITHEKTTTEKISVRIEDSRLVVLLDKELEPDAFKEVVEATKKAIGLNSKCK